MEYIPPFIQQLVFHPGNPETCKGGRQSQAFRTPQMELGKSRFEGTFRLSGAIKFSFLSFFSSHLPFPHPSCISGCVFELLILAVVIMTAQMSQVFQLKYLFPTNDRFWPLVQIVEKENLIYYEKVNVLFVLGRVGGRKGPVRRGRSLEGEETGEGNESSLEIADEQSD